MTNTEFIQNVAEALSKYNQIYEVRVISPIIAQAVLESNFGKSGLSSKYHNYFGLKCGSKWTGKSVNLTTTEEYTVGTISTIKDNFRVYDSFEEGMLGYFEFLFRGRDRYNNLKNVYDPYQYVTNIKNDGYATDSRYVDKIMNIINLYKLTEYDSSSFLKRNVKVWVNTPYNGKDEWYRLGLDGTMIKGRFAIVDGKKYYFDSTGKMLTGFQKIDGRYYFFLESGSMIKTNKSGAASVYTIK